MTCYQTALENSYGSPICEYWFPLLNIFSGIPLGLGLLRTKIKIRSLFRTAQNSKTKVAVHWRIWYIKKFNGDCGHICVKDMHEDAHSVFLTHTSSSHSFMNDKKQVVLMHVIKYEEYLTSDERV